VRKGHLVRKNTFQNSLKCDLCKWDPVDTKSFALDAHHKNYEILRSKGATGQPKFRWKMAVKKWLEYKRHGTKVLIS